MNDDHRLFPICLEYVRYIEHHAKHIRKMEDILLTPRATYIESISTFRTQHTHTNKYHVSGLSLGSYEGFFENLDTFSN